jgi:uncharacterized protein YkwD
MKPVGALLGTLALCLGFVMSPAPARAQNCAMAADAPAQVAQMLAEVNVQRARAGLSRLSPNPTLDRAAAIVACDNARQNRMSHTTADGSTLGSRLRSVGYRFRAANENITARRGGPGAAVEAWMNSGVHRSNILAGEMRQFGGATVRSASGQVYWVMVSALPR